MLALTALGSLWNQPADCPQLPIRGGAALARIGYKTNGTTCEIIECETEASTYITHRAFQIYTAACERQANLASVTTGPLLGFATFCRNLQTAPVFNINRITESSAHTEPKVRIHFSSSYEYRNKTNSHLTHQHHGRQRRHQADGQVAHKFPAD